ncbi:MAG TPA: hypothetical protein VHS53_02975 [Mucilaginibacter sp.]|jgi:hypothetical protein|nr:hypothetical protein [Mucilaginibacter sp.]
MKMLSTYISLLLLCGFMYVFYFTSQHPGRPSPKHPMVKELRPVVKRISPAQLPAVPLDKNTKEHEKELLQARLTIDGFSFFKDVVCHIAPMLKNIR